MSTEIGPKRVAGQHVRAEARRRGWLRFLGGSFTREHASWAQGAEGEEVGIYTVETKSRRGRLLLDNLDPKMLAQSYGEKKALERVTGMEVQALLVFSHAYLIDRMPAKRRGVTILPARMLSGYFARRRPTMSVEQADEIYDRLCLAVGQPPSP